MRSFPLALLLLISAQAVVNMGGVEGRSTGAAESKAGFQERARNRLQRSAAQKQDRNSNIGSTLFNSHTDPYNPVVEAKLFSKRHYRPSRHVMFADVAPSYNLESQVNDMKDVQGVRVRRDAVGKPKLPPGEYSVCEARSTWMMLTNATDIKGNHVTVLSNVTINNTVKKQLFYQTTCVSPTIPGPKVNTTKRETGTRVSRSNCLGIDERYWKSYCTDSHVFVSALTSLDSSVAWRYIRLNSACVCVISRKKKARMVPRKPN